MHLLIALSAQINRPSALTFISIPVLVRIAIISSACSRQVEWLSLVPPGDRETYLCLRLLIGLLTHHLNR
jgi:hypothetical protein